MKIFVNGDSSYLCGRAKTEVFKYDDVMPRFKGRSSVHTNRKRYVWRQIIFKYGGKNRRFRKYPATFRWSNTIQKRYVWTQRKINMILSIDNALSFGFPISDFIEWLRRGLTKQCQL